jgi:hypothetical protein
MTQETGVPPMVEEQSRKYDLNWLVPPYAAMATLLLFTPFALSSADFGEFFYVLIAVPIVSLVLIVFACLNKGRQGLSALSMLFVYWMLSAILVVNYSAVRDIARWVLWSRGYKAQVLGQPASESRGLQHTEWDSWGFGGEDTVVYLVFDPNNVLAAASKDHPSGILNGIPCEVSRIRRLESHWYAVRFFTGTSWNRCDEGK